MDRQFWKTARGRVGDECHQRTRLEIEARPGPQRAKDRLRNDVDELAHVRVRVDRAVYAIGVGVAEQSTAHLSALLEGLALGHIGLLDACER
jgi:hypothetical protein